MRTPADMAQLRRRPDGMSREVFQAFARADSREALLDQMRSQAEGYFGTKVTLREASAQPAPLNSGMAYQGSSRWVARADDRSHVAVDASPGGVQAMLEQEGTR